MNSEYKKFLEEIRKPVSPKQSKDFICRTWESYKNEGMSLKGATNRTLTELSGLLDSSLEHKIMFLQVLIKLNEDQHVEEGDDIAEQLETMLLAILKKDKKKIDNQTMLRLHE